MIVARIIGWMFMAVALMVAAMSLYLWMAGQNFATVAGQLWYQLDSSSLNSTELILERYLHPALWNHGLLPLLQKPAYAALPIAFAVPFVIGLALLILGRKRDRRRRFS